MRKTGPELLRIVAILMVIVLHYLSQADLVPEAGVALKEGQRFGAMAEGMCIMSLNTWVLISGYFMTEESFKPRKLVGLLLEIYFYLIGGYVVLLAARVISFSDLGGVYGIIQRLFPISSSAYWFMSAYVVVYIFSPVLCAGMKSLTRGRMKSVIAALLFFHVLIKSFVPVRFVTDHGGYDTLWFLVLFLIAGYLRKYGSSLYTLDMDGKGSRLRGAAAFLFCGLAMGILTLIFHGIVMKTGHLHDYMDIFYEYNFILCILGSTGLFVCFLMTDLPEKLSRIVLFVSPSVTGVYLLHEHPEIRARWLSWLCRILGDVPYRSVPLLFVHILISVILVFIAGFIVDRIRMFIFSGIYRLLPAGLKASPDAAVRDRSAAGKDAQ